MHLIQRLEMREKSFLFEDILEKRETKCFCFFNPIAVGNIEIGSNRFTPISMVGNSFCLLIHSRDSLSREVLLEGKPQYSRPPGTN